MRWIVLPLVAMILIGCASQSNDPVAEINEQIEESEFNATIAEHDQFEILSAYIQGSESFDTLSINYGEPDSDEPAPEFPETNEFESLYEGFVGETAIQVQIQEFETALTESEEIEIAGHSVSVGEFGPDNYTNHLVNMNDHGWIIFYFDTDISDEEMLGFTEQLIERNE
ncbi:hypothetical protein ACE1TF_04445 [Geomicrobium sp. JSM 1781026]|uniref:hypothetical protein n=1 Tax=Geomicrobium sp. JSM 1781026 TaxID=3344580 RepID=UPI0035BECCE9